MLDLRQLACFVAVAETGNVSRAAVRLNMTQSPLSRQVRDLEDRLGLELFQRVRKRLLLTDAGRDLMHEAQRLLAHADRVENVARSAGGSETLRIGYVEGALAQGLAGALAKFVGVAPNVSVELRLLRSHEQFDRLASGELDVAFTYAAAPETSGLTSDLILDEAFVLAFPEPVSGLDKPSVENLLERPFVGMARRRAPQAWAEFLAACARAGFQPDIRFEVHEPSAALQLVAAGLGVAIVQQSLMSAPVEGVGHVPMPVGFDWRLRLFVTTARPGSAMGKRFVEIARIDPVRSATAQ